MRSALLAAPAAGLLVAALLAPRRASQVRESALTSEDLELHARNHTLVHIGGQHRGGTTLLWHGLSTHGTIGSMRTADGASGTSARDLHGEGIFLQDVYPKLSLDHPPQFFIRKHLAARTCAAARGVLAMGASVGVSTADALRLLAERCQLHEGIAGYAFGDGVHPIADGATARRAARSLLAQWATHWGEEGLARRWLIEKSPSNALLAPWLRGIWASLGLRCQFIFITRHPLMQAFAMRAFVDDQNLRQLLEHWIAVEEGVRRSARLLPDARLLLTSLEALAAHPEVVVPRVLCWVMAPASTEAAVEPPTARASAGECAEASRWRATEAARAWLRSVEADPNEKYGAEYRSWLSDPRKRLAIDHEGLVRDFEAPVRELSGYSLANADGRLSQPPERDAAWLQRWALGPAARTGQIELVPSAFAAG